MARRKPSRWTCPVCGRSVPLEVAECYCGTARAAVKAQAQRDEAKRRGPFSALEIVAIAALLAGVFYTAFVFSRDRRRAAPSPVGAPAQEAARTSDPPPSPAPGNRGSAYEDVPRVPVTDERRAEDSASPPPSAETPSPIPLPTPLVQPSAAKSRADVEQEEAEQRLERTLSRLTQDRDRLSADSDKFETYCFRPAVDTTGCQRLFEEISQGVEAVGHRLQDVEDDARRSWVSPGYLRDLREKHGLSETAWGELSERAEKLIVRYHGGA